VPHLRLELTSPKQTIFLYGNVTPLECAAAHGHVDAMKLLMQVIFERWLLRGGWWAQETQQSLPKGLQGS
jgi:hypothetical protein